MKIGFIISPSTLISGASNGIRQQALTWKEGLEQNGTTVDLLGAWEHVEWRSYDLVHVFHLQLWADDLIGRLRRRGMPVVLSPIIDSPKSPLLYRVACSVGYAKGRIGTENFFFAKAARAASLVLARSQHERAIIQTGLGVDSRRIDVVPIGCRFPAAEDAILQAPREDVCLHVSSYYQDRKNVVRLIEACRSAGIRLRLAGNGGKGTERAALERALRGAADVVELGFVSEVQLLQEMQRCRVFALPSLFEGVGLAAAEAGLQGCGVVVTDKGGPRDYFGGNAYYADPYSTSSIRSALVAAMQDPRQPALARELSQRLSASQSAARLLQAYSRLIPGGQQPKEALKSA